MVEHVLGVCKVLGLIFRTETCMDNRARSKPSVNSSDQPEAAGGLANVPDRGFICRAALVSVSHQAPRCL